MSVVKAGFIFVEGELRDVNVSLETGDVQFYNEDDEIAYELMIPVQEPMQIPPNLYEQFGTGRYGDAIGIVMAKEGAYVIVNENIAELRRHTDPLGKEVVSTHEIDIFMQAEEPVEID